jgi:lysophospholipase L1-like esterase
MKTALLSSLWLQVLVIALAAFIPPTTIQAALGKLGAMGDSLTDEYWDSGVSTYATNWPDLVALHRAVNMGPTAAQAGTNTWGSPRNAGYKYNWALSGATSATLLSEGQATGLQGQAASDGVLTAVLEIGSNDFNPDISSAYLYIYYGLWSSSQIRTYVSQTLANIETALATVRTAGVSVVVAILLDPGATPAVVSVVPDAASRDRVAAAIQSVNAGLKNLAQKYQAPLMDWYGLEKAILGPNTHLYSTLKVGNVNLNLRGSDPGPPNSVPTNAFVSDGFHPNTTLQGIFANVVLQALDCGYGAGLTLFSEQVILSYALSRCSSLLRRRASTKVRPIGGRKPANSSPRKSIATSVATHSGWTQAGSRETSPTAQATGFPSGRNSRTASSSLAKCAKSWGCGSWCGTSRNVCVTTHKLLWNMRSSCCLSTNRPLQVGCSIWETPRGAAG